MRNIDSILIAILVIYSLVLDDRRQLNSHYAVVERNIIKHLFFNLNFKQMHVFYTESNNVYLVSDNYNHTLEYIDEVLEYAKIIGLTVPDKKHITIRTIRGERLNGQLSVEFNSTTLPNTGTLLTQRSPLWEWLRY